MAKRTNYLQEPESRRSPQPHKPTNSNNTKTAMMRDVLRNMMDLLESFEALL
jgi:hypothetical protein